MKEGKEVRRKKGEKKPLTVACATPTYQLVTSLNYHATPNSQPAPTCHH